MSGKLYAAAGPIAAAGVGVLIMLSSVQPEFARQAAERNGQPSATQNSTTENSNEKDTAISRAIVSDFKEAGEQLGEQFSAKKGGFAWAIRQKLFGPGEKVEVKAATVEKGEKQGKLDVVEKDEDVVKQPAK